MGFDPIRETKEDTGLEIISPTFLAVTNDFFEPDQKHYISIFMTANITKNQSVINLEPHKVEEWHWFNLLDLPELLFLPLKNLILGHYYESQHNACSELINKTRFNL